MSLYRIMVSGRREYWETLTVEADTVEEAERKVLKKVSDYQPNAWESYTGIIDIQIEGIEVLEADIPLSSDMAWLEDITSVQGEE